MPPGVRATQPKNDGEYFECMTRALFAAGLNWKMIEKKWPDFKLAVSGLEIAKIANLSEKDVDRLTKDARIVRNEKKIRAMVYNAGEFVRVGSEFGSFRKYIQSFGSDEERLQDDLRERFHHVGPSSARMFLWLAGHPLTPNRDKRKWMAAHR